MKKILAVVLSAVTCAVALSGCAGNQNKKYQLYTNIPQSGFTADSGYGVNLLTGGAFGDVKAEKAENAKDFEARRKEWFGIINTDLTATLVLSDSFKDEEVENRYNSLCGDIGAVLEDINYSLSATVEGSSVYNFNNAQAGARVEITQTAYNVLQLTKQIYEFTEGYYNPAVYYSVQAYGFGGAESFPQKAEELPKDEDIAKYNILAQSFEDIALEKDEENGKFYAVKPEITVEVNGETLSVKLDLGGIGKGYAVDLVSALMDKYGFKFGYFNFGGSSIVYKNHFKAGNYDLAITDPRGISYYMVAPIANQSVSTSGDNAQYYEIDGVRYCHVINPKTGKPVQTGIMSSTILGGSAAGDDAYTTAIMAMGREKAIEIIQTKLTDRRVVFTLDKI